MFLRNYFNTFREMLRQDDTYALLIEGQGTILERLGRDEEARQHFEEANEFLPREWGTLNDEVKALYHQGRYDRAVVVAKKALQVAEQEGGRNHPNVAESLNNLALLYGAQGQYAQAGPLYKRALAIREKALGPDHPDVATILENMAVLYRKTNRLKEAEALEKRAAAIRAIRR
jgi:tetratricopeptide (TPR) repeat protein